MIETVFMYHFDMNKKLWASKGIRRPEKEEFMSAFFATFIETVIKAAILCAFAFAGLVCGKKFKDKRNKQ